MPPRILQDRWFARVYGWTPDQVDALPLEHIDWLPVIEEADAAAQRSRQEQEARMRR